MDEMGQDRLEEVISAAVTNAIRAQLKDFYVDREMHYQHHQFIKEMIVTFSDVRAVGRKTFIGSMVLGAIGLFLTGVGMWVCRVIKNGGTIG